MDTAYERFEIVRIASGFRLFDDESFQRHYSRADNMPLKVGLYVVHWPSTVRVRRFDEHAQYHGPYDSPAGARAALHSLQAMADRMPSHAGPRAPSGAKPVHADYDFVVPWATG